jgi:hypothetical protein
MFTAGEVIHTASRDEALAKGKVLAADDAMAMVDVLQIGTDGGDPETATGLLWSWGARG